MGKATGELNLEGPFTAEEASYISTRKRLRNELATTGNLHLLDPANFTDALDDEFEHEEVPNGDPDAMPVSSQSDGDGNDDDPDKEEEFEPTDRSDKDKAALIEEIETVNEKIEQYNEGQEDQDAVLETLSPKGNKGDMIEALDAFDRLAWELNRQATAAE